MTRIVPTLHQREAISTVSSTHITHYREEGYCLIHNLIPQNSIEAARLRALEIRQQLAPWPSGHFRSTRSQALSLRKRHPAACRHTATRIAGDLLCRRRRPRRPRRRGGPFPARGDVRCAKEEPPALGLRFPENRAGGAAARPPPLGPVTFFFCFSEFNSRCFGVFLFCW